MSSSRRTWSAARPKNSGCSSVSRPSKRCGAASRPAWNTSSVCSQRPTAGKVFSLLRVRLSNRVSKWINSSRTPSHRHSSSDRPNRQSVWSRPCSWQAPAAPRRSRHPRLDAIDGYENLANSFRLYCRSTAFGRLSQVEGASSATPSLRCARGFIEVGTTAGARQDFSPDRFAVPLVGAGHEVTFGELKVRRTSR